jgi:hypothetical protein
MKTIDYFQVTREKLNGQIPEEIRISEFYRERDAKDYFIRICDELCYPWFAIIESNNDYLLIAEAGGTGCDYRIMLTAHYK